MNNRITIIGGGVAGLAAAGALSELGVEVVVIEKELASGGHVAQWDRLFPSRRKASEVTGQLLSKPGNNVTTHHGAFVSDIRKTGNGTFESALSDGSVIPSDGVILATGYDLFKAEKKEEYGYGIYDNVITSAGLERVFRDEQPLVTTDGRVPSRIAFIHCVGSRDEKVGNLYCSKVCCVTGVKQAIEIREKLPASEVFSFYMDLRMYDRNFEELYFEAQQKWGVNFIRGRLSECSENPDHTIVIKTEDTLTGRPIRMTVDLVVLLAGITPRGENTDLFRNLNIPAGTDGFINSVDGHLSDNSSGIPGIFLAGTVKGPATIANAIADGRASALQAYAWLKR